MNMDKAYTPQDIEQHWYKTWEDRGYFSPQESQSGNNYCIVIPPPNVTGRLHMGHGFQQTLMDALTRYHRMCGDRTLWQGGTDHAGIATQMIVERQLDQEGQTRHDLGRETFVKKIWEWKEKSGGMITQQIRRLGASVDWERECFTMSDELSSAVQKVFIELHDEGLIYRGKRLVNWDPVLNTAISNLEVVYKEKNAHLYSIRYPFTDEKNKHVIVATTRPETLFGDTAVAVHPEDERYKHLVGRTLQLPLTNRTIPIIADEDVDPEFGTGVVKITPAHDFTDHAIGERHGLPILNVLTPNGHLNDAVPESYQGLAAIEARKKAISTLEAQNLIEKIEDIRHSVPYSDRSDSIVEPYLTDQWYVKTKPLAEKAIHAVRDGDIQFTPENWTKTYLQWLENIEDWCISRQLWWGHRIPAWYDDKNNSYVGDDEETVRKKYKLSDNIALRQDEDVLDTWFSSALWPFATLGWPENTDELKDFYPTSVLITGFDIIFFWVARMVMMGLKFTGKVPFHEVYITGLIRDSQGQKMSKSKGNVLDPIDLIDGIDLNSLLEKRTANLMLPSAVKKIQAATKKEFPNGISAHGTDALRFTFCALASTGRDINFDMNRLAGYRNFCNKLWNAARFVLMNCEDYVPQPIDNNALTMADRWMITTLQKSIARAHEHFKTYRFDLLANSLYELVWNDLCDWYLEFSKASLTGENKSPVTQHTLLHVLETVLRLLHPLMPFITEDIWQRVAPLVDPTYEGQSIMMQAYPEATDASIDEEAYTSIETLQKIITAIRTIRSEIGISPAQHIPLILHKGSAEDHTLITTLQTQLKQLTKIESITWLKDTDTPPPSATAIVNTLDIHIPLAGLIDVAAETQRLQKELGKLQTELDQCQGRLANKHYVAKAPQDVVKKERIKVNELQSALSRLSQREIMLKTLAR